MQVTRERVVEDIRRITKKLGKNQLSLSEFRYNSEISDWHVWRLFDSWNEAVEEAGLVPHTEKEKIAEDDLFSEMKRVFLSLGGICNRTRFARLAKYSVDVYRKRFGRWSSVLNAFGDWLQQNDADFPFMSQLPKLDDQAPVSNEVVEKQQTGKITSWDAIGDTIYGPFLNFRGLQHAPLNEQGVVFLFGMICLELGFIVEAIRSEYPDCEAKRRINRDRDQWERVRIEFEYRSSNFKEHSHDPNQCDLIVCWIHDWAGCPLEVIELKSAIETISE